MTQRNPVNKDHDDANPENVVVRLCQQPLRVGDYERLLDDPDVGSHGWFIGVTRRTTRLNDCVVITDRLSYQANESMAQKVLKKIAGEAIDRFGLHRVVILHRLGCVPVAEASLLVGCNSPHRRDTFAALPWMLDQIKADVPIWKQETTIEGEQSWVHPGMPS